MKNFIKIPLIIALIVSGIVAGSEFIFSTFEDFLTARFHFSEVAFDLGETLIVTLLIAPVLYFFVLRRVTESEEKFRKINESAQDAIIMMGPTGEVVSWNKAAEQIFGYTKKEALGKKVHTIIAGAQAEAASLRQLPSFFKTGEGPIVGKIRKVTAKRKDGREFTAELSVSSTQINGQWHAIGIVRDIEEVEKTDRALRESEARLAEAQHMTQLGNWELDLVKNALTWSAEIYRIFEIDPEKFGASYEAFLNAIHPDDRDMVNTAYTDSVKTHIPYSVDHRLLMKDGRIKYVHERSETFYDESGKPLRSVGTVQDITDRKKAEEALRVASAYNRSLIEAALDPLVTISSEGKITDVNDATEEVTGHTHEELIGKDFSDYFTNPEKAKAGYREVFLTGAVKDYELEIRHKDGHLTPVLYNATLYRDEQGSAIGVFAAARDITERKKAELALSKTNRALRMLSTTNEALIHTTDESELHYKICEIATNEGGYRMAWIGHVEHDEAKTIRPVGQAGFEGGYIEALKATWAENRSDCGPEGIAIRTKELVIIRDIETDPSMSSCRAEAIKRGYRSMIVLPLKNNGDVFAIFSVYADTTDAFDKETVDILQEMVDDMAFGVTSIHIREARDAAEKEIRAHSKYMESMDKVNLAILKAPDLEHMMSDVLDEVLAIFDCDRAWLITPCDPWTLSYRVPMERTKPEYPGASISGMNVPVDPDTTILFQTTRATNGPVVFNSETDPPLPLEITKHFQVQSQIVMDIYPKESESWMFGMHQCSYERIWTAEEKKLFQEIGRRLADALTSLLISRDLKKSEEEYRRIIETTSEGVCVIDKERKLTFVNVPMMHLLGYEEKEMLGQKFDDFLDPEELLDHERQMKERQQGKSAHYDRRFRHKDGHIIWCSVSATPIFDDKKEFNGSFGMFTDITEHKQDEELIQKNNQLLEIMFSSIHVMIAYLDRDFNFIKVNSAYAAADHREPDFYPGKNHFILYPDKENEAIFRKVVETGEPIIYHAKPFSYAEHPERGITYWDWRLEPTKDSDGRVEGLVFSLLNVTEQTLALKKIQAASQYARSLIEASLDPLVTISPDGKITDVNDSTEDVTGYSREELIGRDFSEYFTDPQKAREGYQQVFETGVVKDYALEIKHKNGHVTPVLYNASVYKDKDSKTIGVFAAARDITERKQVEEKLREQKAEVEIERTKDEALLQSLGEGMIAVDNKGNVLAINKAAEEMIGWNEAEVLNKNIVDILPVLDENNIVVPREKRIFHEAIISKKTTTSNNLSYIRRDGKTIPVAVTATPFILNNETIGAVNIFRDMTEERKLEETRRDLLSLASHQLRTPLSGTKWLIETLQKGIKGPLNTDQKEYLDEIYKINERMTTLVHDMLGVLRMESGTISSKTEQFLASTAIRSVLGVLEAVAANKKVVLRSVIEKDYNLTTDPLLLQNILEVFVSNAITYSPSGTEVVVSLEQKNKEIIFAVKDSGIGIPRNEQGHIFERFYRAANAKTFDTKGTGLGLYIASILAKKLGFSLSFESEEGAGTTFYVHIPTSSESEVLQENSTRV